MKKKSLLLAGIAALLLTACEKDPDMGQLDVNLVVYTDYDTSVDFGKYTTYYMPDSILETGNVHVSYWTDANAKALVDEVENQMDRLGYTRITDSALKATADVGVQLSYMAQANTVITGGYWSGWWNPFYWGGYWGGWYYPYPVVYSYDTQALIIEMADLTARGEGGDDGQHSIPVVWYASASGFQFDNHRVNMQLLTEGVDQAFSQSTYLGTDK